MNKSLLRFIIAVICSLLCISIGVGIIVLIIKHPISTIVILTFGILTYLFYDTFEEYFNDR